MNTRNAIRILRDEHRSISAVMNCLQELARLARDPAVQPEFGVFRSMIYYIDAFPERSHHPKEDRYLFARLLARAQAARPLIEKLQAEHVQGARLVRELERAVLVFEETWPRGAQAFATSVDAYAEFHWQHMRREEQELMPLAERFLLEEDWAAIDAAFAQNADPLNGVGEQDFDELYARILSIAPAPAGLGAPWKRA